MRTEPLLTAKSGARATLSVSKAQWSFTILDMTPKRASLDLDFGPKVEAVPGTMCRRRNRPPSYGLTSPSRTPEMVCMSACGSPITTGHKSTPLLRHHGYSRWLMEPGRRGDGRRARESLQRCDMWGEIGDESE
jgi:hypothetical protein